MKALAHGFNWLLFLVLFWMIVLWSWITACQLFGFVGLWEPQDPGPFVTLMAMFLALGCLVSALFRMTRELQGHRPHRSEPKMRMIP